MKLEQLRAQITAEKVNDKFQILGEKVNLNDHYRTTPSTRDKVIGKLSPNTKRIKF